MAYRGTTFAGYVGLWTGQSPNKFTVSGNQRSRLIIFLKRCCLVNFFVVLINIYNISTDKGHWWENIISAVLLKSSPVSWLVREVREQMYIKVKI